MKRNNLYRRPLFAWRKTFEAWQESIPPLHHLSAHSCLSSRHFLLLWHKFIKVISRQIYFQDVPILRRDQGQTAALRRLDSLRLLTCLPGAHLQGHWCLAGRYSLVSYIQEESRVLRIGSTDGILRSGYLPLIVYLGIFFISCIRSQRRILTKWIRLHLQWTETNSLQVLSLSSRSTDLRTN